MPDGTKAMNPGRTHPDIGGPLTGHHRVDAHLARRAVRAVLVRYGAGDLTATETAEVLDMLGLPVAATEIAAARAAERHGAGRTPTVPYADPDRGRQGLTGAVRGARVAR